VNKIVHRKKGNSFDSIILRNKAERGAWHCPSQENVPGCPPMWLSARRVTYKSHHRPRAPRREPRSEIQASHRSDY